MDIVKVFGKNLKNTDLRLDFHRRNSLKNVVCTEHISAPSSGFSVIFLLKMLNV